MSLDAPTGLHSSSNCLPDRHGPVSLIRVRGIFLEGIPPEEEEGFLSRFRSGKVRVTTTNSTDGRVLRRQKGTVTRLWVNTRLIVPLRT